MTVIADRRSEVDDASIVEQLSSARATGQSQHGKNDKTTLFSVFEQFSWYPWVAENLFQPLLHDPRNDIFVLFTVEMLVLLIPSAAWLLVDFAYWRALVHIVLVLQFAGLFTSILHNSSHKKMYKVDWLNHVIPIVVGPFLGQTRNTYYYHHVKHHHVEDNGPNDLSSTLRFQRDNFFHFANYFLRFLLFIVIELPAYFVKRGQYYNALMAAGGEMASFALGVTLFRINPQAAAVIFLIPLVIVRFGMMSGNWAQHSFIDQVDPTSNYKSSVTCINHGYNREAFNDGYHTSHHLNPHRHWSEHPTHLVRELPAYYTSRPIVFANIDFMGIWIQLMLNDYAKLAKLYVHLGPESERPTEEQIIALLKSRTKSFTEEQIRKHYPERKTV